MHDAFPRRRAWGFQFHPEQRGWTLAPDAHFPPSAIDGLEGVGILVKRGKMRGCSLKNPFDASGFVKKN